MAQVNPLTRELLVKLVYYGPGLGGKTTSLTCIHQASPPESRGQIVSLATPVDRTLYFDFLPLRSTDVRGHHVRLQLFTVPGQVYFNATRKLVLTGADGVVFVADSQRERQDANLESLENLAINLEEQGRSLAEIPLVLQYNKRDLPGVMELDELDLTLNTLGVPSFGTSASQGTGILAALDTLVQAVVDDLERRKVLGTKGEASPPPRFARAEAAFEEQIGRASEEIWLSHESSLPPRPVERGDLPTEPPLPPLAEVDMTGHRSSDVSPVGVSFRLLFTGQEEDVREVESHLAAGRTAAAIEAVDDLLLRLLTGVGQQLGLSVGSNHAVLVADLLGVGVERFMAYQRLVRRARSGGPLDDRDALGAYALLIELRSRRDRLSS